MRKSTAKLVIEGFAAVMISSEGNELKFETGIICLYPYFILSLRNENKSNLKSIRLQYFLLN
jgi:hypothetical protein